MKPYTISPHIADVRLKVSGKSFEQLFIAALQGMDRIMSKEYEKYLNKHLIVKEITLESTDSTSLLIDFLSAVLTLAHINKAIFYAIDSLEIGNNSLHAHILGTKADKFDTDIKAVTYHEADVKRNDKGEYETTIVFDI